ncbi:AsmA family protein [Colwellia sp. Arc7-635]|uniref:AsmA family protein n=1 Tax=Colwellia sp. Arc7-635 TaxID=2497879 RepID=UPI000F85A99E|nr:AsmA family protein [Colwellia sp. Arc7-635]AZQ83388.1 AsmA family protein [Colwellia sp. Arc7-635]
MKTLFKSVAIIIFIIVLLIVAATQLISTQDIVSQVSTKVQQATGRTLTINGEQNLSVFPSLSLELNDVHFSNADGGSKQDMASISELLIHIPWLSVFSGELSIEKFVINNPDILLEKSIDGTANWQFSTLNDVESSTEKSSTNDSKLTLPAAFDISLGQVEINGGKLTYIDHQSKETLVIDQLNLAVLLPSLRQALNFSGSVRYMAQVFELETSISTPAKAINNQPFSVKLDLTSALAELSYEGEILQQGKDITGKLSVSGESVKQLLNWQNIPLVAKDEAFNKFAFTTNMRFTNNKLTLDELMVNLDALEFKGDTAVTLSTPLHISSNIDLGILNLNPYLPEPSAETPPPSETESQPIVWDDTPLDLSALGSLNADITIKSSQLLVRDIKLGKNELALVLNKGIANVQLKSFQGYEGTGHGVFNVNANKKPYKISTKFELANINAAPLLTDAVGFDKLMGKGQLAWNLTTQGMSQRDFIHQLNGDLDFSFIDGAVKGVNLAAIAKSASSIMQGNLSAVSLDSDFSNADKTDFAALTGKFMLKNGVANINNLALNNPFIRISGTGDINLPETKVNLHIKTKVVASTQGQAADASDSGIEIPIKITGPFHDVKIRPDVSSAAKDKVKEKVKDKLKDKLKGLFG